MQNIQIVNQHPESIIAQGLLLLLRERNKQCNIATTSFHYLPTSILERDAMVIVFVESDADVQTITQQLKDLLLPHIEVSLVFIYHAELQDTSIKALANFSSVAILSSMSTIDELIAYMEQVSKEKVVLCVRTKDIMLKNIMRPSNKVDTYQFTAIEQAIIKASRKGASIIQTAKELDLSANTIAAYRSRMLKKSGFKTMGQLLAAQ